MLWESARQSSFSFAQNILLVFLVFDAVIFVRWLRTMRQGDEAPPRAWNLIHPFVAFQLVLLGVSLVLGIGAGHPEAKPDSAPMVSGVSLFGILVQNGLFVAVAAYLTRLYGGSLADIGLRRPTRKQILLGLGLGVVCFAGAMLLSAAQTILLRVLLPPDTFAHLTATSERFSAEGAFHQIPGVDRKLTFALLGAIAAPIGEEVFFRGLVFNALNARFRVPVAVVGSAILFALVHISPLSLLSIFLIGLLLATVYARTGSLVVTILIHGVNNGLAFVLLAFAPDLRV